jgi:hypothetical protein
MQINWIVVLGCSVIPLIVGFVWYSKLLFGNAWMKAAGMSLADATKINMPKVAVISIFLGALMATSMMVWTIHQMSFYSILGSDADQALLKNPSSELSVYVTDFMNKYGKNFRTFKHGAFHGVIGGLFLALPIISMNALFEGKGFKYIAIHTGFWVVCMALIGGIICQWA